jgi:hypothetical protein
MITGSLRNYGNEVDTKNAQISLNGIAVRGLGGTCGQTTLKPRWSCNFSIAVPNATWVQGSPYVLKLVTTSGNFAFPVVAGGNSESVIPTQPNLITFQTVTSETVSLQTPNPVSPSQGGFAGDIFVKNAFAMLAAVVVGILLVGVILGLHALLIVRPRKRGLYDEEPRKIRVKEEEMPTSQVEERQVVRLISSPNRSLVIMAVALGGVALLVISAFMPWLTIDFGFLGSRLSFNLIDFLNLVDFSTRSAGLVLQTIQSTLSMKAFPSNAVLVRDTVFFLLLATVLYALAIAAAAISFVFKEAWLLFSGAFAILSGLLAVVGIETLKANVIAKGETPAYALLVRPDYGIYLALIAGFVFLGAYFITRQSTLVEERVVAAPSIHCPRCGATTPSNSKFCKECGTRVNL